MNDIGLFWDATSQAADLAVAANDLAADDGLETAVMLSLFTDRRAEDGDVLPAGETDRRGWWGDSVPEVAGDRIGSRLWMLAREKDTAAVLERAKEYAEEALAWMLEDRVAERVTVAAERLEVSAGRSMMLLTVSITRPAAGATSYRYAYNWAAQAARRA
jgi:phage gp46-like protein